ncbi:MAG: Gfo/Idh/MocA family oxidoreductase [Clostridia bacterium]|nr:Gfo/Idh/MocA family oxidoreductase [Clostridia bacterium]MBQ7897835.1 Gfo/Idh/MocA family oxidoreductase [Clostridia bacterium]
MKEKIKVGYIGLGRRGYAVLNQCVSEMNDVEVVAICDLNPLKMENAKKTLVKKGRTEPIMTTNYKDILAMEEIDAVFIMTSWNSRIKLAIEAMYAGKYTGIEVGCAFDISECYELVDAYEKTGVPCMMLENCCYGRNEMMALRMVKEGLFGEIVHANGAYHHYLNEVEFFLDSTEFYLENGEKKIITDHYRLAEYKNRCLENYPTHELGPISKCLNINKGNRMLSLVSVASKARGIETYMKDHVPADHPFAGETFKQGDIINTIITCANGETIHLTLDTTLPRAFYSREFTIRGTKGMCEESGAKRYTFFLEGMKEGDETFDNKAEMYEKYDHPLHREFANAGEKGGHGGMDWLVVRAFVESVKTETEPPIDVYDTATWLAIGPLSEASINQGGHPVEFPDFTRGRWFRRENEMCQSKYSLDLVVDDPETSIF